MNKGNMYNYSCVYYDERIGNTQYYLNWHYLSKMCFVLTLPLLLYSHSSHSYANISELL